MRLFSLTYGLVSACCLAGGAALASRLAYAEIVARRCFAADAASPSTRVAALKRAAELDRLAPPDAYFESLAELDPDHAVRWLDAAVEANPRLTAAWIAEGLAAERSKAYAAAEHDLLQAASIDRQYLPAWTLANFYFRRNRPTEFWLWARRAATLVYDDYRPLLPLAHAFEMDPRTAIENLGGGTALLHADLDYLVQQNRLNDAQEIARLLLARKLPADAPHLLALADRQILADRAADALELWNGLGSEGAMGITNAAPLDPDGSVLVNGTLATAPSGLAFDWRLPRGDGYSSLWQAGRLTYRLSGDQPGSCILLEQTVTLNPVRRYRLRFEYNLTAPAVNTGLVWDLAGAQATIAQAPPHATLPPTTAWQSREALFQPLSSPLAPAIKIRLAKLRLLYRREPGLTRAPEEIQLRNLDLEAL